MAKAKSKKKSSSKGKGQKGGSQQTARELEKDEEISVGSGDLNREPLPDDAYLDGVIRQIELRENCPNNFGGDPFDKLAFRVEAIDFEDEHSESGGNRLAFCTAKVSMHPKSNLYKWVKAILAVDPKDGQKFRPLTLLHVPCRFLLKSWENDDGSIGQVITDFKPWKGKIKKGMKDPSEAAEELTGSGGGSKKKTSKKTSKKGGQAASDNGEWFDEDEAETIVEYLREGGADLVTLIADECGFKKKVIQATVKGKDDGEDLCFRTLFLLATNKHADKFEGLKKSLDAWAEAAELDPDDYGEWATFAAHACAVCEIDKWPKSLRDLKAMLKDGPEEGEEEEEEVGEDDAWEVGHRCGADFDGETFWGEITAIEGSATDGYTATVKFDDESEEEIAFDDLIEEEEEEEEEEEGGKGKKDEDDDGLGFLDD